MPRPATLLIPLLLAGCAGSHPGSVGPRVASLAGHHEGTATLYRTEDNAPTAENLAAQADIGSDGTFRLTFAQTDASTLVFDGRLDGEGDFERAKAARISVDGARTALPFLGSGSIGEEQNGGWFVTGDVWYGADSTSGYTQAPQFRLRK